MHVLPVDGGARGPARDRKPVLAAIFLNLLAIAACALLAAQFEPSSSHTGPLGLQ